MRLKPYKYVIRYVKEDYEFAMKTYCNTLEDAEDEFKRIKSDPEVYSVALYKVISYYENY